MVIRERPEASTDEDQFGFVAGRSCEYQRAVFSEQCRKIFMIQKLKGMLVFLDIKKRLLCEPRGIIVRLRGYGSSFAVPTVYSLDESKVGLGDNELGVGG